MRSQRLFRVWLVLASAALACVSLAAQDQRQAFLQRLDALIEQGRLSQAQSEITGALDSLGSSSGNAPFAALVFSRLPLIDLASGRREEAAAKFLQAGELLAKSGQPRRAGQMAKESATILTALKGRQQDAELAVRQAAGWLAEARNETLVVEAGSLVKIAASTGQLAGLEAWLDTELRGQRGRIWQGASLMGAMRTAALCELGRSGPAQIAWRETVRTIEANATKDVQAATRRLAAAAIRDCLEAAAPAGAPASRLTAYFELGCAMGDPAFLVPALSRIILQDAPKGGAKAARELAQRAKAALPAAASTQDRGRVAAAGAWGMAMAAAGLGEGQAQEELVASSREIGEPLAEDPALKENPSAQTMLLHARAEWALGGGRTGDAAELLRLAAAQAERLLEPWPVMNMVQTFRRLEAKDRKIDLLLGAIGSVRLGMQTRGQDKELSEWTSFWMDEVETLDFLSSISLVEDAWSDLARRGDVFADPSSRKVTESARMARRDLALVLSRAARTSARRGQMVHARRYFEDMEDFSLATEAPRAFLAAAREVMMAGHVFGQGRPGAARTTAADLQNAAVRADDGTRQGQLDIAWASAILYDSALARIYALNLEAPPVPARRPGETVSDHSQRSAATERAWETAKAQRIADQAGQAEAARLSAAKAFVAAEDKDGQAMLELITGDARLRAYWSDRDDLLDELRKKITGIPQPTLEGARSAYKACLDAASSPQVKVMAATRLASLALYAEKPQDSLAVLENASQGLDPARDKSALLAVLELQAEALAKTGQKDDARRILRQLILTAEEQRTEAQALDTVKRAILSRHSGSYALAIKLELEAGQIAEAFRLLQLTKSRTLLDVVHDGRPSFTEDLSQGERDYRDRLKSNVDQMAGEYLEASANVGASTDEDRRSITGRRTSLSGSLAQAAARLEAFMALLAARNAAKARQGTAPTLGFSAAQRLLGPDQALVEYAILEAPSGISLLGRPQDFIPESGRRLLGAGAFVVKPTGPPVWRDFASGGQEELAEKIRGASSAYRMPPASAESAGLVWALGRAVAELIFEPLAEDLKGVKRLLISPDGPIWEAPIHALPRDAKGTRVVWDDFDVAYTPSASATAILREKAAKAVEVEYQGSVLVMANPDFGSRSVQRSEEGAGEVIKDGFSLLPGTAQEGRSIVSRVQRADLLEKKDASEEAFKQRAGRYRAIHLATHADFIQTSPMDSCIILAEPRPTASGNGYLTAREIMDMGIRAQMVVLSACNTGRVAAGGAEDTLGLLWAFFAAGARTQVVSQWEADDRATADLMGAFYRQLGSDLKSMPKPAALRAAALEVRSTPIPGPGGAAPAGQPALRSHPYYWGAFYLIGED